MPAEEHRTINTTGMVTVFKDIKELEYGQEDIDFLKSKEFFIDEISVDYIVRSDLGTHNDQGIFWSAGPQNQNYVDFIVSSDGVTRTNALVWQVENTRDEAVNMFN
jgi:hypothetical protein